MYKQTFYDEIDSGIDSVVDAWGNVTRPYFRELDQVEVYEMGYGPDEAIDISQESVDYVTIGTGTAILESDGSDGLNNYLIDVYEEALVERSDYPKELIDLLRAKRR